MQLAVEPVIYRYRYCDRCRREWPAKHTNCPECVLWLGEQPLERTEWQVVPVPDLMLLPSLYEAIAASALILRVVGQRPNHDQLSRAEALIAEILAYRRLGHIVGVPHYGWLMWNAGGVRQAFLDALRVRDALVDRLPDIERAFAQGSRLRWGLVADLLLLPCSEGNKSPCIAATAAAAIFGFEPDNAWLVSPAVFQVNQRWEEFVGIHARRRDATDRLAYAPLGHKRPSAFDHIQVINQSAFTGRVTEIARIEEAWQASRAESQLLAVIAPAGTGKTRMVRHWVRLHPDAVARYACFSIFGGNLADFVGQVATLPEGDATPEELLDSSTTQITASGIQILVLDDLHWADLEAWTFLRQFLRRIPACGVLVVLLARPGAEAEVQTLSPHVTLLLNVLPKADLDLLAQRLSHSPRVAAQATVLAQGNPLFVEHFAAWAMEIGHTGNGACPETLHDLVMARIRHLETGTLQGLRRQIAWTPRWMRADLDTRYATVEAEIGLWLDRLETGDYGDAIALLDYLALLRRVEFELFMAANLSGRPRSRSTRLRESIDRLVIGNADALLNNLQARAANLQGGQDPGLAQQAEWISESARQGNRWRLARASLELASIAADGWQQAGLRERAASLGRLLGDDTNDEANGGGSGIVEELERCPAIDPARLAEIWYRLGQHYACPAYFERAREAAEAIGASGWASKARAMLTRSYGAA